jgi:hypothetical protein
VQGPGGTLEAAFAHHGGQGSQGGVVDHLFRKTSSDSEDVVCLNHALRASCWHDDLA